MTRVYRGELAFKRSAASSRYWILESTDNSLCLGEKLSVSAKDRDRWGTDLLGCLDGGLARNEAFCPGGRYNSFDQFGLGLAGLIGDKADRRDYSVHIVAFQLRGHGRDVAVVNLDVLNIVSRVGFLYRM